MAWSRGEHHDISDPWRVSSLIHAFVEVIVALCVFICAIVSVTTTRLIKSSGLLSSCGSGDVHNGPSGTTGDVKGHQELKFCDEPTNRLASTLSYGNCRDPTPMNIICEDCTRSLSDCFCTLKLPSLVCKRSCARTRSNVVSANNTVGVSRDHAFWPVDDNDLRQKQQESCRWLEKMDSSCEEIEVIGNGNTPVSYGCGCRTCTDTPAYSPSLGRPLKRKFAKVFSDDWTGSCSDPAQVPADDSSFSLRKGSSEIRQRAVERTVGQQRDGLSGCRLSDAGDTEYQGSLTPVKSPKDSSHESLLHSRRSSLHFSRTPVVSRNRIGEVLSVDSESTPDCNGSFASRSHETEEERSALHDDFPEVGVMELREALQEEQEALAALYVELEEERNASSTAAHEAMAMITRLQEEKAAVQMEARQYQRMAEEKQLYDQEALAVLQDILVRRDEEMYALEEEVNLYRKRLLTGRMDEPSDQKGRDEGGGQRMSNDVLLIERETLVLEGSEDWKIRMNSHDERVLAEIKGWLRAANERVAPRIEDLDIPENIQRLAGNIGGSTFGNERKNLLESFSSVAVEDGQTDGVVIEDAETEMHTAAGYESFQGLMASLRKEPSLRDQESLETLNKIEETLQRQSSTGPVRSGDELRKIWKNTLRSFENNDGEKAGVDAIAESAAQNPITGVEPADGNRAPHHQVIGNADAARSVEERRMSVLEYVSKFEEQLHHLGETNAPQFLKSGSSTVESVPGESPVSRGASTEFPARESLDSDKNRNLPPSGEKPNLVKMRLRQLASEARNAGTNAERDRFTVRGQAFPTSRKSSSTRDARFESPPGSEEEKNHEGSSGVHDVYEVQQDIHESSLEVSSLDRNENHVTYDLKKFVSPTVNELVRGEFVDSHETARGVEDFITEDGDRFGELDFISGHTWQKSEANGKEMTYQNRLENLTLSIEEPGMCELDDVRPGHSGDSLQSTGEMASQLPTRVRTDFPRAKMEDVVEQLTHRLKSLETDRQMMQDTISSWRREDGEMKVLQEISQQLRELREMEQTAMTTTDTWLSDEHVAVAPSIKGLLSFSGLRHFMQSQLNKLALLFLGNGDPGASRGDQHVDHYRLHPRSPLSNQLNCIEPVGQFKAVDVANNFAFGDLGQPSTLDALLTQQSWPLDAKERSVTAFSGWDY